MINVRLKINCLILHNIKIFLKNFNHISEINFKRFNFIQQELNIKKQIKKEIITKKYINLSIKLHLLHNLTILVRIKK